MENRGEGLDPFKVARELGHLESQLKNVPTQRDLASLRLEVDRETRASENRLKELIQAQGERHLKEVESAFKLLRSEIDKRFDHAETVSREAMRDIIKKEFEENAPANKIFTADRALLVGGVGLLAVLSDPNLARLVFQMLS